MKLTAYLGKGFLSAIGVFAYICLIAWFGFNSQKIFGGEDSFLAPVFALTLLVFSAAFTGSLVLGRPILWYWDGKKKEAIMLLGVTLAWLFIFLLITTGGLIVW